MNKEKKYFEQQALRYGVQYNGIQEFPDGTMLPMYTHKNYGSFVVSGDETLIRAIIRKRKQFAVENDGSTESSTGGK